MKKIIVVLVALMSHGVFAQNAVRSFAGDDILKSITPSHPRLLLLKGEEQKVLQQVKASKELSKVHREILAECDRIIELPPVEHVKIGRRLLDKSRECLRRVFMLSYAYRTTREEKYLKRCEKELLAVAVFEDWNPTHFLDVAEMTMAVAIGYDWLFNELSPASRKTISEAILKKGIEPSMDSKYNSFLRAENNWNQVCNAGISFGALAIAEDQPVLAGQLINRAVESLPKCMIPSYDPNGAYPEGFGYWDYGTSFNVLFISAVEKTLGTDFGLTKSPGFMKTAGFVEHMVGPTGMAHNWGDSGLRGGVNPATFWFAARTNNPNLLWDQKRVLAGASRGYVGNRILPVMMIWGAQASFDAVKPPVEKLWVGQGHSPVALMRTSWTDSNAIFVGYKAGSPSVNHAHMDVGSFVLDANGERWAMDFGAQGYNSLESKGVDLWNRAQNSQRWEVFRLNNLAHNTLTFNGQLQQVKGYAKIDAWSETKGQSAIVSDISKVYEGAVAEAKRGISIEKGRYVVVRDEVRTSDKPATMRWNLLTPATVKILDGKSVELSQNGKRMLLIFETKAKIEVKTWPTTPTHDYDAANPDTIFVGFEVTLPANSTENFNAYFTTSKDVAPVKALDAWSVKSH
jgi:hypothetical protein